MDLTWETSRLWSTIDFRSPWDSAEPSSDVYLRACMMERSASWDGAQVPFCFWRQSSLRDARTDTTMVRWRAFSGVLVVYDMPSARCESAGCASVMAVFMASTGEIWEALFFSERTDIVNVRGWGVGCGVWCGVWGSL